MLETVCFQECFLKLPKYGHIHVLVKLVPSTPKISSTLASYPDYIDLERSHSIRRKLDLTTCPVRVDQF